MNDGKSVFLLKDSVFKATATKSFLPLILTSPWLFLGN
jgi:hypothetical protein